MLNQGIRQARMFDASQYRCSSIPRLFYISYQSYKVAELGFPQIAGACRFCSDQDNSEGRHDSLLYSPSRSAENQTKMDQNLALLQVSRGSLSRIGDDP